MRLKLKITQKLNPKFLPFNWCPSSPNQGTSSIFFMKTYNLVNNQAKILIADAGTKTLMSGI